MTARSPTGHGRSKARSKSAPADAADVSGYNSSDKPKSVDARVVNMKPRKRLLVALLVLMGAWVIFLLVLYFTTVRRPDSPAPPPAKLPATT